jgi:hypothetical protein
MKRQVIFFSAFLLLSTFSANSSEKSTPNQTTFNSNLHALSVQLFNTVGYTDMEASFWLTAFKDGRHSFNLRLSHERFESQYFGIGLGYGYDFRVKRHSFQPYVTYNHDVETWNNGALVNGLYYTYGGRYDFAAGTTTNFDRYGYSNNSLWVNGYYNIKAYGGIQLGVEYCIMSDTWDKYYGIIFQKTLWRK